MLNALLLLVAANPNCPVPLQPIAISAAPVPGELLSGQADPAVPSQYQVGDFKYQGHGIVGSSPDPRYSELVLDQRFGLRHQCGNSVSAPSGWNARDPDISNSSIRISAAPARAEPSPGSVAAEKRGARPILGGYVSGATWPVHAGGGKFYLGLMHPADGSTETLVVAFQDVPQPTPALIMARIPMELETLSVVPRLHGSDNYLNLASLREGKLTQIVLRLDRDVSLKTYAKLAGAAATNE